ncbi:MAG: ribonuclease P protein component [Dehalococcoidia bacterium]|nr:ribonuclease P protein component [Dehalococcoidia bacterium]
MRREQRLRRRRDFVAAYRDGRTQGNRLLVVRVRPNGSETARFGFVAGKVVGGAVVRNLVKRRLRAIVRGLAVKPGLDVVVGARKAAAAAEYQELERALVALLRRTDALASATASMPQESR